MRLQRSSPWLKSIRRTPPSPTRGSRRAILAVEAMEGRLSLSAMPLVPAVQKPSVHFNPQPDPPTAPVHLGKQPAIIAIAPVQHGIIAIAPMQHRIIAIAPAQLRPYAYPNQ